jgi:hypothetical protein
MFAQGKIIEKQFAEHLKDVKWATREQDMFEHWDMEGKLEKETYKFDVKDMKKFNRSDDKVQDEMALVELKNVRGNDGWMHGKADLVVFKRTDYFLATKRSSLLEWVEKNKGQPEFWSFVKKPYAIYDRKKFGKQDEFCWVPFEDIEKNVVCIKITHKKIRLEK